MDKIRFVVIGEYALGYILPEIPDEVQVLHESILKGAPSNYPNGASSITIHPKISLRGATLKDFDDYRCQYSEQYRIQTNIYEPLES